MTDAINVVKVGIGQENVRPTKDPVEMATTILITTTAAVTEIDVRHTTRRTGNLRRQTEVLGIHQRRQLPDTQEDILRIT